ncbi:hypothetical protein SS37A_30570 [Methylocystis iwaonis]|uniref:Replication protein A n=1 Tax=Methylocystis iwaonis TaxID=2885079 RepID=A0ABN6VIK8_9HYPH|nr:hypothetical protein SS37A_30570 [Methylocystis iwaonis]
MLKIDRAYFSLTGGLERWLYRLVCKHAGNQPGGWSFDFTRLHAKSGALSPLKHFAFETRDIVRPQPIPRHSPRPVRPQLLIFTPLTTDPLERAVQRLDRRLAAWEKL